MLSNLASYLGYQLSPAELAPDVAEGSDVRVRAVEEDDEWLLVEKQEPGEVTLAVSTCPSALPGARPKALQESWYLTPPPSFTSRGPVHMETSPLENLLIEHPSMSVYQKSGRITRRKTSLSSPSASEEESPLRPCSEDGTDVRPPRKERFVKFPRKMSSKYSKKTTTKRPPTSSSDEAVSLPSAGEEESQEPKEVKMKNFVKSPRRSMNGSLKSVSKKAAARRQDHSSGDEMISIPSNNEDDGPVISGLAIQPFAPPRKLYSDVLRTKPKVVTEEPSKESLAAPATSSAPPAVSASSGEEAAASLTPLDSMVVEEAVEEKDRRKTVQTLPDQHRQHFLNRSAQKLEQRKTCEQAKRNTMGRNNKAREINSRNKRQRRSDMMQRHSGANNNRKCC